MTPDTPMDFCIDWQGMHLCLSPKPNSGTGSGSSTIGPIPFACGDGATWSIQVGSLQASGNGNCSECQG